MPTTVIQRQVKDATTLKEAMQMAPSLQQVNTYKKAWIRQQRTQEQERHEDEWSQHQRTTRIPEWEMQIYQELEQPGTKKIVWLHDVAKEEKTTFCQWLIHLYPRGEVLCMPGSASASRMERQIAEHVKHHPNNRSIILLDVQSSANKEEVEAVMQRIANAFVICCTPWLPSIEQAIYNNWDIRQLDATTGQYISMSKQQILNEQEARHEEARQDERRTTQVWRLQREREQRATQTSIEAYITKAPKRQKAPPAATKKPKAKRKAVPTVELVSHGINLQPTAGTADGTGEQ